MHLPRYYRRRVYTAGSTPQFGEMQQVRVYTGRVDRKGPQETPFSGRLRLQPFAQIPRKWHRMILFIGACPRVMGGWHATSCV